MEGDLGKDGDLGSAPPAPVVVARGSALVMTSAHYDRLRKTHRHVGARLHVPNVLHDELVRKLGGDDPDGTLVAWYGALDTELEASRESFLDVFQWLRPRFVAWASEQAESAEWEKMLADSAALDAADAARRTR
jgi:hypothetical protein